MGIERWDLHEHATNWEKSGVKIEIFMRLWEVCALLAARTVVNYLLLISERVKDYSRIRTHPVPRIPLFSFPPSGCVALKPLSNSVGNWSASMKGETRRGQRTINASWMESWAVHPVETTGTVFPCLSVNPDRRIIRRFISRAIRLVIPLSKESLFVSIYRDQKYHLLR